MKNILFIISILYSQFVFSQDYLTEFLKYDIDLIIVEKGESSCFGGGNLNEIIYKKNKTGFSVCKIDTNNINFSYPQIIENEDVKLLLNMLFDNMNSISYKDFNITIFDKIAYRHLLLKIQRQQKKGKYKRKITSPYEGVFEKNRKSRQLDKFYLHRLRKMSKIPQDSLSLFFTNNNVYLTRKTKYKYSEASIEFINTKGISLSIICYINSSKAWGLPFEIYCDTAPENDFYSNNIRITKLLDKLFPKLITPKSKRKRNIRAIITMMNYLHEKAKK